MYTLNLSNQDMEVLTNSPSETKELGEKVAKQLKNSGSKIFLKGNLGAGKTAFTQGFAKGLGISQKIISPSFLIIREYKIPNSRKLFYHVDLYRFNKEVNIQEIGLSEILESNNFVVVEWADKLTGLKPDLLISFESIGENSRKITFSGKIQV